MLATDRHKAEHTIHCQVLHPSLLHRQRSERPCPSQSSRRLTLSHRRLSQDPVVMNKGRSYVSPLRCIKHPDRAAGPGSRVFCNECLGLLVPVELNKARQTQLKNHLQKQIAFDPHNTEWCHKTNEEISNETGHHRDYVSKLRRKYAPNTVQKKFSNKVPSIMTVATNTPPT